MPESRGVPLIFRARALDLSLREYLLLRLNQAKSVKALARELEVSDGTIKRYIATEGIVEG